MDGQDSPLLIEGDSRAAGTLFRAFEEWAGHADVRVYFEPNTMMAVDTPGRRGFLFDETYFVTIWAGVGGDFLLEVLDRTAHADDEPAFMVKDPTAEPKPEEMIAQVLEYGVPIDQVRRPL